MKAPLGRSDPEAALTKAEAERVACEARLVKLQSDRSEALLTDSAEGIAQFDSAILTTERKLVILADQISALKSELSRRRHEQREKDKAAAIEVIASRFEQKNAAAAELEAALAAVGEAFVEYQSSAAAIFANWPRDLLGDPAIYVGADGTARAIGAALGMQGPAPDTRLSEIASRVGPIGQHTAEASAAVLAALRGSPLPAEREAA